MSPGYTQTVVPDPFIPCKPGWCLQYVRQAFGAPIVEPTATAGWFNARYRHTGTDFPDGCWVPVWFELDTEPAGHVALLDPDGSVYSTTSPYGDRATHHPSLGHLYAAYAPYNPLTWRGWTEDISGVRVVQGPELNYESTTTTEEDDMPSLEEIAAAVWGYKRNGEDRDASQILKDVPADVLNARVPYKDPVTGEDDGRTTSLATTVGYADFQAVQTRMHQSTPAQIAQLVPEQFVAEVVKLLTERLAS
jgi:hypothetical protein